MNNSSDPSKFLQGSGGVQSQNSVNQSPNSNGVQQNGSPYSLPGLGTGNQSALNNSDITVQTSTAPPSTETNELYQPSAGPSVWLIFLFFAFVLVIFGLFIRKILNEQIAADKNLAGLQNQPSTTHSSTKSNKIGKKKKSKKPHHR